MNRQFLVCLFLIVVMSSTAFSFDRNRKGFVLGGGVGFAPQGQRSSESYITGATGMGPGLTLLIGGAFSEINMLVYETNMMAYWSEGNGEMIVQGFSGPTWYQYIGDVGKSFFMNFGLGVYVSSIPDRKTNDPGLGMLLGCGYEFARHWQIGGYYSWGHTKYGGSIDFSHYHFNILICGIAF